MQPSSPRSGPRARDLDAPAGAGSSASASPEPGVPVRADGVQRGAACSIGWDTPVEHLRGRRRGHGARPLNGA
jgi:hypothetical protein